METAQPDFWGSKFLRSAQPDKDLIETLIKPTLSTEMLMPALLLASGADLRSGKIVQGVFMDVQVRDLTPVVERGDCPGGVEGTGVSVT